MKYGPLLVLGLLFALALSWLGMVATPQFQLGGAQPTNVPPANLLYPTPRSGVANLGREVYRANGCAYCHTQVVRQDGTRLDVVVTNPGTNQPAVLQELVKFRSDLSTAEAEKLMASTPSTVLSVSSKRIADAAQKALADAGAEANVKLVPLGPDIERGWGTRLTVAPDYLYDSPLMLGSTRLGPDLTNIGLRQPDETWHLLHLYDPRLKVAGSPMPRYPFLFEKRPRGAQPSPNSLPIPGDQDIVPTPEARALVAYMLSLQVQTPLFQAPAPRIATAASGAGDTNAPPTEAATNGAPAEINNPSAPSQAAPK